MSQFQANQIRTPVAARVLDDGTLVELVFDPIGRQTALIIDKGGTRTIATSYQCGDETLVPFSPRNNLIVHGAILLPSHPEPHESMQQLTARIVAFIHRYVDLTSEFEQIATQYILLSWVHDAFNELPYLRLQGDYGTGKTRALIVLGSIAYRGFFASGASTVSPIFHTLNAFGGTLIFDEADFRMSDEKAELVKILNNGTVKGMPVLRTMQNQKREFSPAAFKVFGPKIVATRGTYDDRALESRFLTELMGGRELRADIPINLPKSFHAEALALRNQLLSYRLAQFHSISLDSSLIDRDLEPRHNQILIPLLSITPDPVTQNTMRNYLRATGQSIVAERSVSIEGQLLAVIRDLFHEYPDGALPLRLVREAFVRVHGHEFERPVSTRYLAHKIRRSLAIRVMKTAGVMAIPFCERTRIAEIGKRFGLDNTIEGLSRDLGRKGDEDGVPINLPIEIPPTA